MTTTIATMIKFLLDNIGYYAIQYFSNKIKMYLSTDA